MGPPWATASKRGRIRGNGHMAPSTMILWKSGMGCKSCRGLRLGVQLAAEASNIGTAAKLCSSFRFGARAEAGGGEANRFALLARFFCGSLLPERPAHHLRGQALTPALDLELGAHLRDMGRQV